MKRLFKPGQNLTQKIHQLKGLGHAPNAPGQLTPGLQDRLSQLQAKKKAKFAAAGGKKTSSSSSSSTTTTAKKKAPWDLLAPLTRKSFRQELGAATRDKFGEKQREIEGQIRGSDMQAGRLNDWFNEYQNRLANIQSQNQASYAATDTKLQQNMATAASGASADRSAQASKEMHDAQVRGVNYTPTGTDLSAGAASARGQIQGAYGGMIGSQGATNYAYLGDKQRIGEGEKINQLLREGARKRSYGNDLIDLLKDKGEFKYTYRKDARDSERKYALSQKELGTKVKTAKLSAKTSRDNNIRTTSTSAANNAASNQQSNINSKRSARTSTGNSKRSSKGGAGGRPKNRRK